MRSYALLVLALAVLYARAATIPVTSETEKKLPTHNDAIDDVSLDNSDSEHDLVDPANSVNEVQNNLRNSIPENVPVKVIEEQPVVKTVALKEDSNDYVPDNDDSVNIKRVEIDLKNPGPPERQEHDSQNPGYYVDKERAVAAIRQSIAQSEKTFKQGIQDVTQKFKNYFANNEELSVVQQNIQNLRESVNAEVSKLSETINSCLKPQKDNTDFENLEKIQDIKVVENNLKTLEKSFKTGVDMLTEGVELLSILKEEDEEEKPDKISGKADNESPASAGPAQQNPTAAPPSTTNPVFDFIQQFSGSVSGAFNNLYSSVQGIFVPQANGTSSGQPFNPSTFFQNINFPNPFQNQGQDQNQGAVPAGAQSDDAGTTTRPTVLQQISNTFQSFVSPGANQNQQPSNQQQTPNPILQAIQSNPIVQAISSWTQPRPPTQSAQQTNQASASVANPTAAAAADQPAASQGSNSVPAAEGTNSVPAAPAPPASPPQPAKESEPVAPQAGPIQQIIQNSPIVQGITHTVQRIQGLSNPSKPRETPAENTDGKGHSGNNTAAGDNNISGSGVDIKPEAPKEEPQATPEVTDGERKE